MDSVIVVCTALITPTFDNTAVIVIPTEKVFLKIQHKTNEMTTHFNEELVRNLTTKVSVPLVFRGFVSNWSLSQWNVEKWCTEFGNQEIPFRCMKRDFISDEPCWERRCKVQKSTFRDFVDNLPTSQEWMYFDYKYLHEWFGADSELYKVSVK